MLANVLYAKLLSPTDFGRLVLVETIASITMGISPFGFETLIGRKEVNHPRRAIAKLLGVLFLLGVVVVAVAHFLLPGSFLLIVLIVVASLAGAATRLFAAIEQSELRFSRSMLISQLAQFLFLATAVAGFVFRTPSWEESAALYAGCFVFSALLGLFLVRNYDLELDSTAIVPIGQLCSRGFGIVGATATLLVLGQMEKLVAAETLGMRELGTLGLASTLVASPFKLLSAGVGYTLLPRLRATADAAARKKMVRQEFWLSMTVGALGALVLIAVVPKFVTAVFGDEYTITYGLVLALVALGIVRLNSGVISATINSLGDTKMLYQFTLAGWVATALAAAAAFALAGYGSIGVVAGVTIGWLFRNTLAAYLVRKEL